MFFLRCAFLEIAKGPRPKAFKALDNNEKVKNSVSFLLTKFWNAIRRSSVSHKIINN